jgi:deoxyribose-phosphate aldolase
MEMDKKELAKYIDYTLLKPDAKEEDIRRLCIEAKDYGMKAVCIPPCFVSLAKNVLKDTEVKIATVVGFPLGYNTSEVKVYETKRAIENGADEIDVVINISKAKDGRWEYIEKEISEIVKVSEGKIIKVIIETCLLTMEEKVLVCKTLLNTGAHFVKTSTGFSTGGATIDDIKLIKSIVRDKMEIKAAGGIRDKETAIRMIEAGATRIGTSSALRILNG